KNVPIMYAGISAGVFVLALIAYIIGGQQGSGPAKEIAVEIVRARWLINACFEKAKTHTQQDQVKLRNETADSIAAMNQRWKQSVKDAIEARGTRPARVDEKAQKAFKKNDELFAIKTRRLDRGHTEAMTKLRASLDAEAKEIAETHRAKISRLETEFAGLWSAMVVEWKAIVEPIYKSIREANEFAAKLFPPWEIPRWKDWEPPLEFQ